VPRELAPFPLFVADSENWCYGPVFEMRLLYRADELDKAWRAVWVDEAVLGPFKDWALTEKAPPGVTAAVVGGSLMFGGREESGFRAGVGVRKERSREAPGFDRWLELWLPPRMAKRIYPGWEEARKKAGPENEAFWESVIALVRRIKNRVPFRLAWLGNEYSGPLPDDVERWLLGVEPGTLIVDQSCPVDGGDILDLGRFGGRGG